jgi:phage anti-repressor protein
MLEELIKVEKSIIGNEEVNSVNMRDVYNYLGVKSKFADWVKREIESLMLEEMVDYVWFLKKKKANNSTLKECIVNMDIAKMVCMQSRTLRGKEAKEYFIKVEKELQNTHNTGILSLKDDIQIADLEDQLHEIKNRKLIRELKQQLEIAKILGRSFDVNQFISRNKLSSKDTETLSAIKSMVGSSISELGGIELPHAPITKLLGEHNINIRAMIFNNHLEEAGILDNRVVTEYGNRYGFNWQMGQKTNPRWYSERFAELLTLLRNEGYID